MYLFVNVLISRGVASLQYGNAEATRLRGVWGSSPRKFLSFLGRFWGYVTKVCRTYGCLETIALRPCLRYEPSRAQRKVTVLWLRSDRAAVLSVVKTESELFVCTRVSTLHTHLKDCKAEWQSPQTLNTPPLLEKTRLFFFITLAYRTTFTHKPDTTNLG